MNEFAGDFGLALDDLPTIGLSQVAAPLPESDRARLTEFWSRVFAEAGADLPGRRDVPVQPVRRARRVQRQHTVRLVRVLPAVRGDAVSAGSGVAA